MHFFALFLLWLLFEIWLSILVPSSGEDKNPFEDQYNTAKCTGDDSFLYHGRCYTFYNTTMTWTGARDFCKQKGSELPVLMDTLEGARLNYEAYSDGEHTKFWTDVRFEKVCDPLHSCFEIMPSGKRYRTPAFKRQLYNKSFIPFAVRFLNSQKNL